MTCNLNIKGYVFPGNGLILSIFEKIFSMLHKYLKKVLNAFKNKMTHDFNKI